MPEAGFHYHFIELHCVCSAVLQHFHGHYVHTQKTIISHLTKTPLCTDDFIHAAAYYMHFPAPARTSYRTLGFVPCAAHTHTNSLCMNLFTEHKKMYDRRHNTQKKSLIKLPSRQKANRFYFRLCCIW